MIKRVGKCGIGFPVAEHEETFCFDDGTCSKADRDMRELLDDLENLPSAQPDSCKGCKHMGLWENEVEYGYPSPCIGCKRRASDNYER